MTETERREARGPSLDSAYISGSESWGKQKTPQIQRRRPLTKRGLLPWRSSRKKARRQSEKQRENESDTSDESSGKTRVKRPRGKQLDRSKRSQPNESWGKIRAIEEPEEAALRAEEAFDKSKEAKPQSCGEQLDISGPDYGDKKPPTSNSPGSHAQSLRSMLSRATFTFQRGRMRGTSSPHPTPQTFTNLPVQTQSGENLQKFLLEPRRDA